MVTSYADALNRTTNYGYDGYGRITSATMPYGDSYAYTYDGRGNLLQAVHTPAGGGTAITTSASFDSSCSYPAKCNKPNSTTDGNGNVTNYTYDNNTGVLLTATKPSGENGVQPQTRYTYTWLSANIKNASGQTTTGNAVYLLTGVSYCNTKAASACIGTSDETRIAISYDANHNLAPASITVSAGDGSITSTQSYAYDVFGNPISSTNPLGGVSSYLYDADRELTGIVGPDPDGSGPRTPTAARISYTPDGLVSEKEAGTVSSASNFSGFSTVLQVNYAYDSADRLAQTTNTGAGLTFNLTQYAYDNANNLQCAAVRMNTSTFGSEPGVCALGTTGLDGPDRIAYRTYDAADEPYQIIEGYGSSYQRTAYTANYTSAGKLSFTTDANGNNSCYGYDGFERLNAQSYPTPSSGANCNSSDLDTYGYDGNSNLTSRRFRDGSTQSYSYDADNNIYSDGTTSYGHDNLGRLTNGNSSAYGWALTFDALGRPTYENNSYGGNITSSYDAAGDRIRLTYQDGNYINYDHDLTGAVTAIRENGATSGIGILASYSFDGLGRVTGAAYGGVGSDSWSYDSDGRPSGYTHTLNNDSGHNLVVGLNYSASNQLRTRTYSNNYYEWTAGYNFENNYAVNGLNQVTNTGSSALNYNARGSLAGDGSNTYGYSTYNQLTSVSGSANATLAYNPLQRLVQTTGSATTEMIYDGSMIAEEFNGSGAMLRRYVPGPDGRPLVWYEGSSLSDRRWPFSDQIGTIQAVMNSSGQSDGIDTYDAYGVGASSNIGRFQFAGRPWIPEAGLYDNSARTYSPTLGRFLQTDPAGYADGLNWYAYTHDDPVNGTDPTGLCGFYAAFDSDGDFTDNLGSPCIPAFSSFGGNGDGTLTYNPDGKGGIHLRPRPAPPPQGKQSNSCHGPRVNFGGGGSGTVFAGVAGASAGASGTLSVPVSSLISGNLQGVQFTGTLSVTPLVGFGLFAGLGPNATLGGASGPSRSGLHGSSNGVIQAGAGDGGGVEISVPFASPLSVVAAGGRLALGAYAAIGRSFNLNLVLGKGGC